VTVGRNTQCSCRGNQTMKEKLVHQIVDDCLPFANFPGLEYFAFCCRAYETQCRPTKLEQGEKGAKSARLCLPIGAAHLRLWRLLLCAQSRPIAARRLLQVASCHTCAAEYGLRCSRCCALQRSRCRSRRDPAALVAAESGRPALSHFVQAVGAASKAEEEAAYEAASGDVSRRTFLVCWPTCHLPA
jgi:hypothetical protein